MAANATPTNDSRCSRSAIRRKRIFAESPEIKKRHDEINDTAEIKRKRKPLSNKHSQRYRPLNFVNKKPDSKIELNNRKSRSLRISKSMVEKCLNVGVSSPEEKVESLVPVTPDNECGLTLRDRQLKLIIPRVRETPPQSKKIIKQLTQASEVLIVNTEVTSGDEK